MKLSSCITFLRERVVAVRASCASLVKESVGIWRSVVHCCLPRTSDTLVADTSGPVFEPRLVQSTTGPTGQEGDIPGVHERIRTVTRTSTPTSGYRLYRQPPHPPARIFRRLMNPVSIASLNTCQLVFSTFRGDSHALGSALGPANRVYLQCTVLTFNKHKANKDERSLLPLSVILAHSLTDDRYIYCLYV